MKTWLLAALVFDGKHEVIRPLVEIFAGELFLLFGAAAVSGVVVREAEADAGAEVIAPAAADPEADATAATAVFEGDVVREAEAEAGADIIALAAAEAGAEAPAAAAAFEGGVQRKGSITEADVRRRKSSSPIRTVGAVNNTGAGRRRRGGGEWEDYLGGKGESMMNS